MNTLKAIEKAYGTDAYFAVFLDRVGAAIKTGAAPLPAIDAEIGSFKAAFRLTPVTFKAEAPEAVVATDATAPAPKVRKKRGPNKKTLARLAAEAAGTAPTDAGSAEVTAVSSDGGEVITKTASGRGRGRRKRTGLPLVPTEETAATPIAADVAAEVSEAVSA